MFVVAVIAILLIIGREREQGITTLMIFGSSMLCGRDMIGGRR
jgi:hypothetical protein